MRGRKEVGLHIPGHSCCNKNFQILQISDLDQLDDDAKENHDYIACLFFI